MAVDNMTELRKRIPGGKYALARAISERAKQLQNGALPLVEVKIPNPITVAIDEVVQGKVTFGFIDADQLAKEASDELLAADAKAIADDAKIADTEIADAEIADEAPAAKDNATEIA